MILLFRLAAVIHDYIIFQKHKPDSIIFRPHKFVFCQCRWLKKRWYEHKRPLRILQRAHQEWGSSRRTSRGWPLRWSRHLHSAQGWSVMLMLLTTSLIKKIKSGRERSTHWPCPSCPEHRAPSRACPSSPQEWYTAITTLSSLSLYLVINTSCWVQNLI